jgi:hypothetical protein
VQIVESSVKAKLNGTCTASAGPDLTGYPHLVYAPAQWGEGVRIASNGQSVEEIAGYADTQYRDTTLAYLMDETAQRFSISWPELFDALCYARDGGTF